MVSVPTHLQALHICKSRYFTLAIAERATPLEPGGGVRACLEKLLQAVYTQRAVALFILMCLLR